MSFSPLFVILSCLLWLAPAGVGQETAQKLPEGEASRQTFHITPLKPVEELRREALAATPPHEEGKLRPDLVELVNLDPTIKLDIRYASSNNFMGAPFYSEARAFMQRPAAEAVLRANRELKRQGYGLLVHDAYRPWYVTKMFWDGTPDDKKIFVADPKTGSKHNRGCAVDLTLYDMKTGKEVHMPSGYDEMSERAYADYTGGTEQQRRLRSLLRSAMEKQGFAVYEYEWWHFDYKDSDSYPILNTRFEDLRKMKGYSGRLRATAMVYGPEPGRISADGSGPIDAMRNGRCEHSYFTNCSRRPLTIMYASGPLNRS